MAKARRNRRRGEPGEYRRLACGVDSLDLSCYVEWGPDWLRLRDALDKGKTAAAGTDGVPFGNGSCLILPTGKKPNFRWHLQWPRFHLFIGISRTPQRSTPNVFASINAEPLWHLGVVNSEAMVVQAIEALGGRVLRVKVNRCDPCVDFLIPGGLSLDFLRQHRVPRDTKNSHNMSGDRLETFYAGSKDSPVQLRIYDKATETRTKGEKLWFLDVWGLTECRDVWRVEFQLRRQFWKQVKVETVADLWHRLPGVWAYLTEKWFSLRLPDDGNVSRRTVHPWWEAVQQMAEAFGSVENVQRTRTTGTPDLRRLIASAFGYFMSIETRRQKSTLTDALADFAETLRSHRNGREQADATRLLRELLSAKRISKRVTVTSGDEPETKLFIQEGPIAFVESTTLTDIFDEDANRCLLVQTDERREQTRRIMQQTAKGWGRGGTSDERSRIMLVHHAMQRQLKQLKVTIPCSARLSPDAMVRRRRHQRG